MARRRNGAAALHDTKQLLADTNAQIEDLRRRRTDELAGKADEGALDKFDGEIKRLETLVTRHQERIELLQAEGERVEAERRAREKKALIERIERKLFDERKVAAQEIADGIAKADAAFRKLLNIARDVQAAWPWQHHDLPPTLLAPGAIIAALQHEIFRQGGKPLLLGGQDKAGAGMSFPGGKAPRLELTGLPDKVKSLVDVVAEAGSLASTVMRTGRSTGQSTPEPIAQSAAQEIAEPSQREQTPAEAELVQLLNKQMELAEDITPEGEAAYRGVVEAIARVQGVIESEKAGDIT